MSIILITCNIVLYKYNALYHCVYALPLMQKYNILDIPENDLFLVEDVNGDIAARVEII